MLPDYGSRFEQTLRENRPKEYKQLQKEGKLRQLVTERAEEAKRMHLRLREKLLQSHPPSEEPRQKKGDLLWIENTAEELTLSELGILVPDHETTEALECGEYVD